MNEVNQELIAEYEKFPMPLEFDFDDSETEFVIANNPRQAITSDQFEDVDSLFADVEVDSAPLLSQSWSDISLNCDEIGLRSELESLEDELNEELDMKFNVEGETITVPKISKTRPALKNSKYKYQNFEAITARLDYEDLEILRALRSNIKVTRQQYVKPDGVKRERITENMILRSLVKTFVHHSLENQKFNWGQVNTEEDLLEQIEKAFK